MSIEAIRRAFKAAAGGQLHLDHAGLGYQGRHQVLTLTGWHGDGLPFAMVTEPFDGSPIDRVGAAVDGLILSHGGPRSEPPIIAAIRKHVRMGKLQEIANRAPQVVKALEDRADKLGARLDALEKRGNGAFDKWDGHLTTQESAVSDAEKAINQLSNGGPPLDDSSKAPQG